MNTTFRRIIAMILVVSLTMTMTGCTDGAGGSVLDKLAYVVGNVIHAAVFAVGELIISGIFEGLDKLITPIEEWLGWGDWWDVQRAGVPVVIWYGRLVDPNNKFDNWDLEMEEYKAMYQNQDDSDEEEQLGGLPQTGGGESDIGFPHTGQEEPSTEPPATEAPTEEVELPETGEEEPAVQMPQTGRAEPEKKSFFGRIWDMFFGCDHVLMLNTEILEIQCDCGESCLPYTPEMTFDEFMDYVTKDVLQEEEEYEAYASREYARYRIHHSDECFHMNSDLELYGLDLKTDNKVRCVQCGDELSPMHYYFSDYLEAKYGNSNYKKLNKEKLKLALTEYVGIKGMSYDAWNRVMNQETDQNKVIQMASGVHEGIQLVDSYFQLLYQDKKNV